MPLALTALPSFSAPTSCAVAVATCDDTGTGPDLGWLTVPAVVLVVVVISVLVYFGRSGGRGH